MKPKRRGERACCGYERNKGWMLIGQKHEANLDVCTRMRFWVTDGGTSKLPRLFWIQGNGEALTSMTDWCGCSRSSGLRRNPLALFTPRPPPRPPRVRPLRHQHQKSPVQLPAEHMQLQLCSSSSVVAAVH